MSPFSGDLYEDEIIKNVAFAGMDLSAKEFNGCSFSECDFTDADLRDSRFDTCSFTTCNLSNSKIKGARFIDIHFDLCKIAGLDFFSCAQSVFSLRFSGCRIVSCNFIDIKMKLCGFVKCDIMECYFQNAFLVEADFSESIFDRTIFHNCDLQRASFCDAHGYSIDPINNKVRKAVFSVPDVLSLLDSFGIVVKG